MKINYTTSNVTRVDHEIGAWYGDVWDTKKVKI
jgi:hypothetical protein